MIAYIAHAPDVTEQDGMFLLDLRSGKDELPIILTPHELTRLVVNIHRALDEFNERQRDQVVEFRQQKGGRSK